MNGVDPETYLHYVIERIADHRVNRIDEMLPWNVVPLLPAASHIDSVRQQLIFQRVNKIRDGDLMFTSEICRD